MSVRGDPANTWQKRFVVHAFQFMNVSTSTYRDEQVSCVGTLKVSWQQISYKNATL